MQTTVAERLKSIRTKRGYATAAAAIAAFGWTKASYVQHESGTRIPKDDKIQRYARAYRVTFAWLKLGLGDPNAKTEGIPRVRFGGMIGAGQVVDPGNDLDGEIDAVFGEEGGEAFEVRGDSMRPLANNGDIAFFGAPRPLKTLLGLECIVELVDGRRMFKTIERGSRDGLYSLFSYNSEPVRDCEIVRAGPLAGIKRTLRR